jgi:hypothetical protein
MDASPTFWKLCSSCKKPIGFASIYQVCSVSTCNHVRRGLQFCSVSCWSAHVPILRHKDAWALEKRSPTREEWAKEEGASAPAASSSSGSSSAPRAAVLVRPPGSASTLAPAPADEVLVVVSKVKAYIKARSDMNTAAELMDTLSEKLRTLCDQAIASARADGRKTVMSRDL